MSYRDGLDVYAIYHAIQRLTASERRKLWEVLEGAFPRALKDTNPTPKEVWDDPRNGFGKKEVALLRFLCNYGATSEMKVLKHLWPNECDDDVESETKLRQRLRKLEQRIKKKLLSLQSDWRLRRPKIRQLGLWRIR
jgi:hypothetical protein